METTQEFLRNAKIILQNKKDRRYYTLPFALLNLEEVVKITTSKSVANQAARLALSEDQAVGFAIVDADTGKTWMLVAGGNPATSGDWLQLGDRDIQWGDVGGKPADASEAEMTTGTESAIRQMSPLRVRQSITNAAVTAAIAEDSAAVREAAGAQSTSVGFMEDFTRSDRYAEGAVITTGVSLPVTGAAWRLRVSAGTAPTVTGGGLKPQTGSLFYLGSTTPTPNGKFKIAYDWMPVTSAYPSGPYGLGLNVSYGPTQMISSDGSGIDPTGVVHCNISIKGVSATIYGGATLTCLNGTESGGSIPWAAGLSGLQPDRRYTLLLEAEGDYLRITLVGVGSLLFHHADLSTKIGATETHWWWEGNGDALGANQYSVVPKLFRVWSMAEELDQLPAWGGANGGTFPDTNQTVKSRLRVLGPLTQSWLTGSAPSDSDLFATPGKIKADGGFWCYPYATTAEYPAELAGNLVTAEISSAAGDSNTARLNLFDFNVATNGQGWEYVVKGTFAANGNNKAIQVWCGTAGAAILESGTLTESGTTWELRISRNKLSGASHYFHATLVTGGGAQVLASLSQNFGAISSSVQVRLTTPTSAGDVKIQSGRGTLFLK